MQKKKETKKQNKTNEEEEEKKHPGPTFSHIDRRGLVNKGSITCPKQILFLQGHTIIKTVTVPQESFIKRVDHTSTGIPILDKLQIHFNGGQNLLSFLHRWNTARYFLSEESCFKNTVHSAKTCMWPYTESLWWTRKHWKSANVFGFDIISELISKTSFWAMHVNQKWCLFSFNMPWCYQICIAKCLYSYRDDMLENWAKPLLKNAKSPLPVDVRR